MPSVNNVTNSDNGTLAWILQKVNIMKKIERLSTLKDSKKT